MDGNFVDNMEGYGKKFSISAVDLFCGVGGLTNGLIKSGINVVAGVDVDPFCEYAYEFNNRAKFIKKSVSDLSLSDIPSEFDRSDYTLLAGCAPCQPFSTYSQGKSGPDDDRWNLLAEFGSLIAEIQPDLVTMENVPRLAEQAIFDVFVEGLISLGYSVSYKIVNCAEYGVPQQRQRLVLLASALGEISLIAPTTPGDKSPTVRDVIEYLPAISAGEVAECDVLHQSSELSELNLLRIRSSRPGGSWREWPENLIADCHKKKSGKTYGSVYGRMSWDRPAPTMTTQFYGFGNGRFGHPSQDRAISLREGALLQSFPREYQFVAPEAPISRTALGRMIGNAVPVNLAKSIGDSIVIHVGQHQASKS